MDHTAEMRAFVLAMDGGSFATAARKLGLTPSAISKLVSRLEARLGVRLVNRTTRSLALTAEGEVYLATGRRILESIAALEAEVAASAGRPRGLVRINTGVAFGLHQLVPAVPAFRAAYPEVELEIAMTDRIVDLATERADIAIRTALRLADSSLMSRRIADMERVICASPDYIARHGAPATPADLAGHDCIVFRGNTGLDHWPFRGPSAEILHVHVKGSVAVDNAEAMVQLAIAGVGIVRLGDLIVAEPIRRGELVPLLADVHVAESVPMWAVFAPGTQRTPRIRVLIDFLVERFGSAPWRCECATTTAAPR